MKKGRKHYSILDKTLYNRVIRLTAFFCASFIPLLFTKPGQIAADTKSYLYIDPIEFTKSALYMWSQTESLGTVTHQNIGYLFPMGPFYSFLIQIVHLQPWISQRLWTASCIFFAGLGISYLFKTLNLSTLAQVSGGFIYMLSPYAIQYYEYLSALLLPYVALGWLLAFTIKAAQTNDWFYVWAFGLTLSLTSSINATAVVYLGLAPLIWLIYAVVSKYITFWRALLTSLKLGLISLLTSLWWISGLWVEDKWGINILKFTETVQAVASTSTPLEVLRGLGYWYFYVTDAAGLVLPESIPYQHWIWLIAISFTIPLLSIVLSFFVKWKEKAFFASLLVIGLTLSVGTHPYNKPSIFGALFKKFMLTTTAGNALRSTDRATPLVILGIAALISCFIDAAFKASRFIGVCICLLTVALSTLNDPAIFNGGYVDSVMSRGNIPTYTYQAANYLNKTGNTTRALIEPGQDFADYTYGYTNDPVLIGLTKKPVAERVQVPYGTYPSVNLLEAFDLAVQNNYLDPSMVAPIARELSVGDLILESDYNWELYEQPDPQYLYQVFTPTPQGLQMPLGFGKPRANNPPKGLPDANEQTLYFTGNNIWPNPIMIYPVKNAPPIIRLESTQNPLVIDGGGTGLVNTAATGLMNNSPLILYAGTLESLPGGIKSNLPNNSTLVITDTNRREARIWTTLRDPIGITLYPWQKQDNSVQGSTLINLFPKLGTGSESTAFTIGARYITSSSYGNTVAFTPEVGPYKAFDGNLNTNWLTSGFSNPIGQWIKIVLNKAVTINKITLYQARVPLADRVISKVRIKINNQYSKIVRLTSQSLSNQGQSIQIPTTRLSSVEITIEAIKNLYYRPGVSPVGFSEIGLPYSGPSYPHAIQAIKLPSDLLSKLGASSESYRLIYVFSRERVGPFPPRTSPELSINRLFYLPTQRAFGVSGFVNISALIPDQEIDTLTGRYPPGSYPGAFPVARSEGRLIGDLNAISDSAFEQNSNYVWQPEIGASSQNNTWIELDLPKLTMLNNIKITIVSDHTHSIPTELALSTEQGLRILTLNSSEVINKQNNKITYDINFAPISGRNFRLTILKYQPKYTTFYATNKKAVLPVAIAHISINNITVNPLPQNMPAICQNNLISLMNTSGNIIPIWVKILGSTKDAMEGKNLRFVGCGPDKNGVTLPAGSYFLTTGNYQTTGFDVNQVVFDSLPGGKPSITNDGYIQPINSPDVNISVSTFEKTPTYYQVRISNASQAFWLVFGQSYDDAWKAFINNRSLGTPVLVNGYANAWLIKPNSQNFTVNIVFYPQHFVDLALLTSFISILICLIGLLRPFKRIKHAFKNTKFKLAAFDSFKMPELARSVTDKKYYIPIKTLLPTICLIAGFFYCVANLETAIIAGITILLSGYTRIAKYVAAFIVFALGTYLVTYVAIEQHLHNYQPGSPWPSYFDSKSSLVWIILAILVSEVISSVLKRQRAMLDHY